MEFIAFTQSLVESFSQSYFYASLKIFFGVYSIALIIDIIAVLSFRDFGQMIRQGNYGTANIPTVSKSEMKKKWMKLEERLESGNVSEYKVAVIEADAIVEKLLTDIGYGASLDMSQKIEQLRMTQSQDADAINESHRIRNRIVFEEDFQLSLDEAKSALDRYKNYLKKYDYFQ